VILFDTDVLIEHLKGNPAARRLLEEAVRSGRAACSVLTRFELLAGMRSSERHLVRSLLACLRTLPVTAEIADQAGEWARKYRRSHSQVGAIDYLIAATAQAAGADLLTLNVGHFPMFPALRPAL